MPELVTSGFSLVNSPLSDAQLAQLYITLARLLRYDRHWESHELFVKANEAVGLLSKALIAADQQQAITGRKFFL